MTVDAVEANVEAGLGQHPNLVLLAGLAPDEVSDVGMPNIKDHHLGRPSSLASTLNGAGRRVGTSHEAHRSAGLSAAPQSLPTRPDGAQVDARTGTALEDRALLDVPVQDGRHLVVHGEDEAGRGLLGYAGHANVEPDGRVEGRPLGHNQVPELGGEGVGLVTVDEIAVVQAPIGDRSGHPVGDLAQRALALWAT